MIAYANSQFRGLLGEVPCLVSHHLRGYLSTLRALALRFNTHTFTIDKMLATVPAPIGKEEALLLNMVPTENFVMEDAISNVGETIVKQQTKLPDYGNFDSNPTVIISPF
jgi:hypothetical protein